MRRWGERKEPRWNIEPCNRDSSSVVKIWRNDQPIVMPNLRTVLLLKLFEGLQAVWRLTGQALNDPVNVCQMIQYELIPCGGSNVLSRHDAGSLKPISNVATCLTHRC